MMEIRRFNKNKSCIEMPSKQEKPDKATAFNKNKSCIEIKATLEIIKEKFSV